MRPGSDAYCLVHHLHARALAPQLNKLHQEDLSILLSDPRMLAVCLQAGYHQVTC